MFVNQLSGHDNTDLCIDGKSGFSQDISCRIVHSVNRIGRDARNLSFASLHLYFKTHAVNSKGHVIPHCSRTSLQEPDCLCTVHIYIAIVLVNSQGKRCPSVTEIVERDVKLKKK